MPETRANQTDPADQDEAERPNLPLVRDKNFIQQVRETREALSFVYYQGMIVSPDDSQYFDLSDLLEVQYHRRGRPVTRHEWHTLGQAQRALATYFTAEMQKQRQLNKTKKIIAWLPLTLLATTVFGIALSLSPIFFTSMNPKFNLFAMLTGYLFWTLSLGGLGAAASLAVNSLAVRNDATFDLSDRTLIWMRMAIGAVFAFVLSFAISLDAFKELMKVFLSITSIEKVPDGFGKTATFLLLPFILGFSTSLVIMILDRFVIAVEAFFSARFTTLNPVAAGAAAGAQAGAAAGAVTGARAGAATGAQAGAAVGGVIQEGQTGRVGQPLAGDADRPLNAPNRSADGTKPMA